MEVFLTLRYKDVNASKEIVLAGANLNPPNLCITEQDLFVHSPDTQNNHHDDIILALHWLEGYIL